MFWNVEYLRYWNLPFAKSRKFSLYFSVSLTLSLYFSLIFFFFALILSLSFFFKYFSLLDSSLFHSLTLFLSLFILLFLSPLALTHVELCSSKVSSFCSIDGDCRAAQKAKRPNTTKKERRWPRELLKNLIGWQMERYRSVVIATMQRPLSHSYHTIIKREWSQL